MTDRKPRKQNPRNKRAAAGKQGKPDDPIQQEPDATPADSSPGMLSAAEPVASRGKRQDSSAMPPPSHLPAGAGNEADPVFGEDQVWDQPFPGGPNESNPIDTDPGAFPGGLNGGEDSDSELGAFPGSSTEWQTTTADAGFETAFPGSNNHVGAEFGHAADPFPGGHNRQSPEAPPNIVDEEPPATEIAQPDSEDQVRSATTPVSEPPTAPLPDTKKRRRRKK